MPRYSGEWWFHGEWMGVVRTARVEAYEVVLRADDGAEVRAEFEQVACARAARSSWIEKNGAEVSRVSG